MGNGKDQIMEHGYWESWTICRFQGFTMKALRYLPHTTPFGSGKTASSTSSNTTTSSSPFACRPTNIASATSRRYPRSWGRSSEFRSGFGGCRRILYKRGVGGPKRLALRFTENLPRLTRKLSLHLSHRETFLS
jgi:hypothetical protein